MFQKIFKRIFIVRSGALGDFVLTLPMIAALRRAYPESRLTVAARGQLASLARGYADCLLNSDILSDSALAGLISESDLLICWGEYTAPGDFGGELLALPAMPPEGRLASQYYFDAIPYIDDNWQPPRVLITEAEKAEAHEILRECGLDPTAEFYAVHAGSGGRKKCWPPQRYATLIEHLRQRSRQVLLLSGEADRQTTAQVLHCMPNAAVPVAEDLRLRQLAAVLSTACVYAGNDSGVSHLAAAAGAPSVVIFGPTDPAVWAPAAPGVYVLTVPLDCRPCGTTSPPCPEPECLESITVDSVLAALAQVQR